MKMISRWGARWGERYLPPLRGIFACDLRSLAAFRIGLALLLLIDLADRTRDLRAHYTDWGVLPRGALVDLFLHPAALSLHFMNGTWQFQAILFLAAAVSALGLLIGYRTRLMTVASWILLVSLQNRNPLVLQGGDILFRMLLFWAMFLPLGARWSFDSREASEARPRPVGVLLSPEAPAGHDPGKSIVSAATVALLAQVFVLYFFAGILKTGPEWTRDDTAVHYAMHIDQLTTGTGRWLLGHPELMKFLTRASLAIELYVPFLFFIPFWTGFWRLAAILILFGMQIAFGMTIRVFIFPWICFCATIPFLPSFLWDLRAQKTESGVKEEVRSVRKSPRWMHAVVTLALAYIILWNLGTLPPSRNKWRIGVPRGFKWIGSVLRIDQMWNMFAPFPLKDDGWYVIPGTLRDGTEVDVFRGGEPVSWEKPERVAYTYKNQRWQKYMMNLWSREYAQFREFYARYLCRSWNSRNAGNRQLDRFTIFFMREDTRPTGEAPPVKVHLWDHYCFKRPVTKR